MQSLNSINYRSLTETEAIEKIMERQEKRQYFLNKLTKMVYVCSKRNIRLIFENPLTGSFLSTYFLKEPNVKDWNRMRRGDYFVKPTGYWFFNCEPTYGESFQYDKEQKKISEIEGNKGGGICSEERSMISPDYARNFICDFILGKEQEFGQMKLF
jgi:hypothetical protein